MSDRKVIPFRRREPEPSQVEVEMYRVMTRHWPDQLRQLMFPALFEFDARTTRTETR